MIVDSFTEDEILSELYIDYTKNVKPRLKKQANKFLAPYKKRGAVIREPHFLQLTFRSKMGNKWTSHLQFGCIKNALWSSSSCCIVENVEKHSKDYYILRGLSDKPYFVKLSSHVVKRMRQRNGYDAIDIDYAPCQLFRPHETAIVLNYLEKEQIKNLELLDKIDDFNQFSKVVITYYGMYYALKLEHGNYFFKTYISPEMTLSRTGQSPIDGELHFDRQGFFSYAGFLIHQYFNKFMYSEEELENWLYKHFGREEKDYEISDKKLTLLKP